MTNKPDRTDAEQAAWLADKIAALGDYAKEAAEMLRRWPIYLAERAAYSPPDEPCARCGALGKWGVGFSDFRCFICDGRAASLEPK